jgi:hypothetical protein
LSELVNAANYLNIPSMYLLGCQSVATLLKGQPTEQVLNILGLENGSPLKKEKQNA